MLVMEVWVSFFFVYYRFMFYVEFLGLERYLRRLSFKVRVDVLFVFDIVVVFFFFYGVLGVV